MLCVKIVLIFFFNIMVVVFVFFDMFCINSIWMLVVDVINKFNSGYFGLLMGCVFMGYVFWDKFFKYNFKNLKWFNCDCFVFFVGYGCMLFYVLLYFIGYDFVFIEDIKQFWQWGFKILGYFEIFEIFGVEVIIGFLGVGIFNVVGLVIVEFYLVVKFNKVDVIVVDYYIYVIMGDGCNQEGVFFEVVFLVGYLKLGKFIVLYDDNSIIIDGCIDVLFIEDVLKCYEVYGWYVQYVVEGNIDVDVIVKVIEVVKVVIDKLLIIKVIIIIGYGFFNKVDIVGVYGVVLGEEEVVLICQ